MKMIRLLIILLYMPFVLSLSFAQVLYRGTVLDAETNKVMPAVSLKNQRTGSAASTDGKGRFSIVAQIGDSILFQSVGYAKNILLLARQENKVFLSPLVNKLDEVTVNTGYYQISKERATGSFSHLDNRLLNRSPSPNILDRMENMITGFQVDRTNISGEQAQLPNLRVRGVASINSNTAPLIVLDGFPYDNSLSTIDPNAIESITFLKDAAASSIWGARAGNGVVVITSKSGSFSSRQKIQFSSSFQLQDKPDLFYTQDRLPAETVMEIEDRLFEQGIYPLADNMPIPYYVELKYALQNKEVSKLDFDHKRSGLASTDFRKEANKYLYQKAKTWQQNLTVSGGGDMYNYAFMVGNTRTKSNVIGKDDNRLSIQMRNGLKLSKTLKMEMTMAHVLQSRRDNGLSLSELYTNPIGPPSTYTTLMGENGPAAIIRDYRWLYTSKAQENGLLDWTFRPLQEAALLDKRSAATETRLLSNWTYAPLTGLTFVGSYQYVRLLSEGSTFADKESYYTRDLVNRLTQADGTLIIPHNGIMRLYGNSLDQTHSGRVQGNYSTVIANGHSVNALAGVEIRTAKLQNRPTSEIYDYDRDLKTGSTNFDYTRWYDQRPIGAMAIPSGYPSVTEQQERFLSYYTNIGYSFRGRYGMTGSLRWDASNLFGVKANQRGVPLWSVGGRWDVAKELFAKDWSYFNRLSLRGSFGSSGNVDQSASVFPTVRRGINSLTQLPDATVVSVGNPSLRWERVNITNLGIDYSLFGNSVSGSIDMYLKKANDLLGYNYVDPTTGLSGSLRQMINYAKLHTKGIDVQVNTVKPFGSIRWNTANIFSAVGSKVKEHMTNTSLRAVDYLKTNTQVAPVVGKSLDVLYALPWNGLSPVTGMPVVFLDGRESTEYNKVLNGFSPNDLIDMGSRIPVFQGSTRQSFNFKGFEFGFLIVWKGNYVFRANSMAPGAETQGNGRHHTDYFKRWKGPGDERITTVPATTEKYDSNLDVIYSNSEILVQRGDHIRLQDIRLSYGKPIGSRIRPLNLNASFFVNNIGILWRANKKGIDPDYPSALYPAPRTYNIGINLEF